MKYFLWQTILIILMLGIFTVADYGLRRQHEDNISRIEDLPVIILSHDIDLLRDLALDLLDEPQVAKLKLESNVEILRQMIADYELPATDRILDIDLLPNKLEFFLEGSLAAAENYKSLQQIITERDESLLILSQDEELQELFAVNEINHIIRQMLSAGILLLIVLVSLFLRITSIRKDNSFWQIYCRSGGRVSRLKRYLLTSLIVSFLPVISFGIILHLGDKYLPHTYFLDLNSWLIIIGAVLITCPLAWLITDRQ